jgi:hypothetical protein
MAIVLLGAPVVAFSKTFERNLDALFRQRTHWLRSQLGAKGAGKPPLFRRKNVNKGIRALQATASDALARKLAKAEFEEHVLDRKNFHIKGRGPKGKKKQFEDWFGKHFSKRKGLVYALWRSPQKCIYIGRTGPSGSRPSSHFEKYWFSGAKRITIYSVIGKSHVPKLECLAIHRFQPSHNVNRAASKKWTKACPLCTTHKYIEKELRDIFRFR